jgi:hypothetical protein
MQSDLNTAAASPPQDSVMWKVVSHPLFIFVSITALLFGVGYVRAHPDDLSNLIFGSSQIPPSTPQAPPVELSPPSSAKPPQTGNPWDTPGINSRSFGDMQREGDISRGSLIALAPQLQLWRLVSAPPQAPAPCHSYQKKILL